MRLRRRPYDAGRRVDFRMEIRKSSRVCLEQRNKLGNRRDEDRYETRSKRLNEEDKYEEVSKTVKGLIKSAIGRSEKIELEKSFLISWKGGGGKEVDDEDALQKNAEEALDKLTTFESALEEREEHAAEMLKVATERRKREKRKV